MKKSDKITSNTQGELYESINDMKLSSWIQCIEGNIQFVRKEAKKDVLATEEEVERWFLIYDGYIKKYGLNAMYIKLLKLMQKKAILELNFVMTLETFKLTLIAIQEEKLKQALNNKGNSMSIQQSLIHLSKWMGGNLINKNEISAEQYFDLLEEYGKHN